MSMVQRRLAGSFVFIRSHSTFIALLEFDWDESWPAVPPYFGQTQFIDRGWCYELVTEPQDSLNWLACRIIYNVIKMHWAVDEFCSRLQRKLTATYNAHDVGLPIVLFRVPRQDIFDYLCLISNDRITSARLPGRNYSDDLDDISTGWDDLISEEIGVIGQRKMDWNDDDEENEHRWTDNYYWDEA
jgi:hypothetical protein